MGIRNAGPRFFSALAAALLASHAGYADPAAGVCSKVEALRSSASANASGGSIESLLLRKYPAYASCASWLARSCLSSYRPDNPDALGDLLSEPWKSPEDAVPTLPVTRNLDFTTSCENDGPPGGGLEAITDVARRLDDPLRANRRRFAREVLDSWAMMERKREADYQVIVNFIQKYSIPRKFSMVDSATDPKDISGNDFKMAIKTLLDRVNSAINRDPDPDTRRYLNLFVGQQIVQASSDLVTPLRDGGVDRQLGMYNRLLQEPNDQSRFALLLQRAYEMDASDGSDVDGFLTSYHAKMLLLYYIDNQIHAKLPPAEARRALNELARSLQLKLDYTPGGEPTQWRYIIPHNGFVLGATDQQIANLWATSFKPGDDAGVGTGTDCTTFLQSNLARYGYPVSQDQIGQLDSGRILGANDVLGDFSSSPAELTSSSARDLRPGDILVFGPSADDHFGHAEAIVGYATAGDPPRPQLVVVSARGGYVRGIIKETLDIYPQAPENCATDSYFSENPDPKVYQVRLTRPPKN